MTVEVAAEAGPWSRGTGPGLLLALVLPLLCTASLVVGLATGPAALGPGDVVAALTGSCSRHAAAVIGLRAPRVALALIAGGGLALAGAALQALFRNPLADPGLTGITGGAALGAVTMIVFQHALTGPLPTPFNLLALPMAAFLGGLVAVSLCHWAARTPDGISIPVMLLAGIGIGTLAGAGLGVIIYLADDAQLRSISFWTLGTLGGAHWPALAIAAPFVVAGGAFLLLRARALDALALGEAEAYGLGVDTRRLKSEVILIAALISGVIVSLAGMIGFVGLVAPHIARLLVGAGNRAVLPASALIGGTLLVLADAASRIIAAPAEVPIGILTSLAGGMLFLWLLVRRHGR